MADAANTALKKWGLSLWRISETVFKKWLNMLIINGLLGVSEFFMVQNYSPSSFITDEIDGIFLTFLK